MFKVRNVGPFFVALVAGCLVLAVTGVARGGPDKAIPVCVSFRDLTDDIVLMDDNVRSDGGGLYCDAIVNRNQRGGDFRFSTGEQRKLCLVFPAFDPQLCDVPPPPSPYTCGVPALPLVECMGGEPDLRCFNVQMRTIGPERDLRSMSPGTSKDVDFGLGFQDNCGGSWHILFGQEQPCCGKDLFCCPSAELVTVERIDGDTWKITSDGRLAALLYGPAGTTPKEHMGYLKLSFEMTLSVIGDDGTPPTPCGGNKAPCSTGDDCCSGNCKNGECKGGPKSRGGSIEIEKVSFLRGDSNADGAIDISDSMFTLDYLFLGGSVPTCQDAVDANDDGRLDISDGIHVLSFLFAGSATIPAPYPVAGLDPTPDSLGCLR